MLVQARRLQLRRRPGPVGKRDLIQLPGERTGAAPARANPQAAGLEARILSRRHVADIVLNQVDIVKGRCTAQKRDERINQLDFEQASMCGLIWFPSFPSVHNVLTLNKPSCTGEFDFVNDSPIFR